MLLFHFCSGWLFLLFLCWAVVVPFLSNTSKQTSNRCSMLLCLRLPFPCSSPNAVCCVEIHEPCFFVCISLRRRLVCCGDVVVVLLWWWCCCGGVRCGLLTHHPHLARSTTWRHWHVRHTKPSPSHCIIPTRFLTTPPSFCVVDCCEAKTH